MPYKLYLFYTFSLANVFFFFSSLRLSRFFTLPGELLEETRRASTGLRKLRRIPPCAVAMVVAMGEGEGVVVEEGGEEVDELAVGEEM